MLKRNLYKFFLLAVLALASCNSIMEDENIVQNDDAARSVMFTLSIDDASRQTRAAWSDNYVTGEETSFDNRISLDGLQVFIFTADNRYIGKVANLMHYWSDDDNSYHFAGEITDMLLTAGNTYKIVVMANNPGYATNIEGMYYNLSDIAYPSGYIPMWGVSSFELNAEQLQHIGDISLLRAAAKIEVDLSEVLANEGYKLEAVTINHYNESGFCAPNGWNTANKTNNLDQENCLRPYHSHKTGALPFYEVITDKVYSLYIPEFNVIHNADARPKLSVTLSDGSETIYNFADAIQFGQYNDDGFPIDGADMYNIVRNHIYRFTISGISKGLEIKYSVAQWDEVQVWDRGNLEYPTYHNPVVPNYFEAGDPITSAPVMTHNSANPEEGAFSVWFKMSAPLEQIWDVAINDTETDYEIKVYDEAGNDLEDQNQWKASNSWYNIKIIPLNPNKTGNILKFGITYHPSWMPDTESMYLMINGKADAIAWPNSGNDPKIIEILQK